MEADTLVKWYTYDTISLKLDAALIHSVYCSDTVLHL